MADINPRVSVVQQIRLIAGLRWRILRNGLRRENRRLDLFGLIFAGFFGSVMVLGLSAAFFAGGYNFISGVHPGFFAFLFWALFVWWQVFPIFLAGFGASFEFKTLLRFPLSRTAFYLISLAYGLADFSSLAAVCWLIAMTVGAAVAKPAVLPGMMLIVVLFVLMNVTLERLIGSWLERLLSRRRTRELFFVLFLLVTVSIQFIQPLLARYGSTLRPGIRVLLPYVSVLPASLAGRAVAGTALAHFTDLLIGVAGLSLYALFFSALLWFRFASQYRGEELSESAAPSCPSTRSTSRAIVGVDTLKFFSPQVAEVLRKEFRYLIRNGFSFFLLIMPPLFIFLFTMRSGAAHSMNFSRAFPLTAFFPAIMGYLVLILMSPGYNCFAYEGRGIQTYYMAPLRFRDIFLGKNLMMAAVLAFEISLATVVFAYRLGLPSAPLLVATLFAIVFTVFGQFSIANWSSLSFPRKLEFGQMRGQRQSGMAALVAFGVQLLIGGISAPIFFMGKWTGNPWLPAQVFAFLAVAAIAGYFSTLDALTLFAEKQKEKLIEALCR